MSSEWHALFFLFGALAGFGVVFQGWFIQTSLVGAVAWVAGKIFELAQSKDAAEAARKVASVATDLHLPEAAYWFLWGAGGSAAMTLIAGYAGVYALAYRRHRRLKHVDSLSLAGRRAAYFLAHGVRGYLAHYEPGVADAKAAFRSRRVRFSELLLEHLRRAVAPGGANGKAFEDFCELAGGTMLTLLFENDGVLKDYRLAIYAVAEDGKTVLPIVTVNRGDWWSHSREPFDRQGSFLGCCLDEGRPLVYPRDKAKRKFQKRGQNKQWKSFLAMPIPCDASPTRWGAITVDHAGDEQVFNSERVEAVRDFARYVEVLYSLKRKEGAA